MILPSGINTSRYLISFTEKMGNLKRLSLFVRIFFAAVVIHVFTSAKNIGCRKPIEPGPRAYYLSDTGNDDHIGSIQNPWQTIEKINSIHLEPGDSVFFEGGKIFSGKLLIDSNSRGTEAHPILISSYGNGHAKINGGNTAAVTLYLTNHVFLKNLDLAGYGRKKGNGKDGLSLINCHHITADSLDISGFQKSGLLIFSSTDILISNIKAHDNGAAGIAIEGSHGKKESRNIQIRECRAENNPGDPTNLNNHSGNGIVAGHCTNLLIDHCTATNNGWDMPRIGNGPVGIWCYESDSVTIQHCLSYRNKTSVGGADGGGFDFDGGITNSIIQYCLSYENQGSGYCIFQYRGASPWYNNVIRYNISENDGTVSDSKAGINIWNSSGDARQFHDCLVYNNTIYNTMEAAINFSETSERKQFGFYNNIFIGKDNLIKGDKGMDIFHGNDWWGMTKKFNADGMLDFSAWAKKYQKEMISGKIVGFNIDPHFKAPGKTAINSFPQKESFNKYKIPVNSLLRNRGLDLLHALNINTGHLDFNQKPAPAKAVGASF